MRIFKFGGSSVAAPDSIRRVVAIVSEARAEGPLVVVVSALGGVTNDLLAATKGAAGGDETYREIGSALRERHLAAARELAPLEAEALSELIELRFAELRDLLHGVFLLRESSPRTFDSILAYGERLSAEIVAASLRNAGFPAGAVDARDLIVTDDAFGNARVEVESTYRKIRLRLSPEQEIPVITGFVAATVDGHTTTLGRGGSDYTAALVGAAVDAKAVELWTDVDGVMSADPRLVSAAFPQAGLSYAELMELSHFGAKVVYAPSIHPARSQGIPLLIKNTFNPSAAGTLVTAEVPTSEHAIRGISAVNRVALMRLEGDGMVGVPGIAMRLFGALARRDVSVILISQSSSEHSICFAVAPGDAEHARDAVQREFALERQAGIVDELIIEADQSIIAAVGEQMRQRLGLAGRLFQVLGSHGINVRAIAQGSSELNISLVVDHEDEVAALNAIHGAFFAPRLKRVHLGLIGVGQVGSALLEQLRAAAPELRHREHLDLRVVALANSRKMVVETDGIDLETWRQQLGNASECRDPERLRQLLAESRGARSILIDCTASAEPAEWYAPCLEAGTAVVAANKLPFVGSLETFGQLCEAADQGRTFLFHEATVGAGLPVLSTLADLRRTGDRIERIDGVLSGSVSAIFDRLGKGEAFSAAVRAAREAGFTEPHPWEDLSGRDVARKLCILSRLAGHDIELADIEVEPVLSGGDWSTMDVEAFWQALPRVDEAFAERQHQAESGGRKLRYVASLGKEGGRVALEAVPTGHPAHSLCGSDNLVAFTTERYSQSPLALRGPGAGPAVTAAGIFADVLRAIDRL